MQEVSNKKVNVEIIDTLRGVAILSVFFYHYHISIVDQYIPHSGGVLQFQTAKWSQYYASFSPFNYLSIGVQFFLVISGFLIHYLFLVRDQQGMNIREFYLRRFWRIYPPYLLILLFFAFYTKESAVYHLLDPQGRWALVSHLFMIHNLSWNDSVFLAFNPSFWSLALEMQLYLLYPAFLFFRAKWGIERWCKILMTLHIIALLALMYVKGGFPDKLAEITFVFHYWIVWALGALVAEGYYKGKAVFGISGWVLVLLSIAFYCSQYFIVVFSYFSGVFAALLFALLLEYLLFRKPEAVRIPGVLTRFFALTGLCSYSIYLIHQPLIEPLISYFKIKSYPAWFQPLGMLPIFAVVFCISYSLYVFVEMRSVSYGKDFIKRLRSKSPKASSESKQEAVV